MDVEVEVDCTGEESIEDAFHSAVHMTGEAHDAEVETVEDMEQAEGPHDDKAHLEEYRLVAAVEQRSGEVLILFARGCAVAVMVEGEAVAS